MRFGAFKKRKMAEEQEEIERSISALEKHIIDGHADDSAGPARGVVRYQYTSFLPPGIPIYLKNAKTLITNT